MNAPIKILLVVSLVAITHQANAHWDDWWSDGSHMLDEVTCTAEDLSNKDDDWYRRNDDISSDYDNRSYSDNDNYNNRNSYYSNENNKTSTHTVKISGNTNDDTKVYTLKTTDHLVKPLEQMPKPGYKQGLSASCVFAGLAFSYQLLKGKEINEGVFLLLYIRITNTTFADATKGVTVNTNTANTIISLTQNFDFSIQKQITDISKAIDNGMIVLSAIETAESNNYHNIVIVGYTDDGNCEYYIYYDTATGEYKLIDQSDVTFYYIGLK